MVPAAVDVLLLEMLNTLVAVHIAPWYYEVTDDESLLQDVK
jgi:hypothetical protein